MVGQKMLHGLRTVPDPRQSLYCPNFGLTQIKGWMLLNRVSKTSRMSLEGHVDPVRKSLSLLGYEG
jgi:hypothetical protein